MAAIFVNFKKPLFNMSEQDVTGRSRLLYLSFVKFAKTFFPTFVMIWKRSRRYHGLNGLDKKLREYLKHKNGFFIEIGAGDGVSQSNTLWFERNRNWRGILIEPLPALYRQCRINRPASRVFNCACVAQGFGKDTVRMVHADLMSIVSGYKTKEEERQLLDTARRFCDKQYEVDVPARTMTSILDECGVSGIDFLSLDVEGYELNVLKGLDLNKYCPRFILIETEEKSLVDDYLKGRYDFVTKLSPHDYLYKHVSLQEEGLR